MASAPRWKPGAGGEAARVFVLSIPDYAYTPFVLSQGMEARRGLEEQELVASDGLHPSGAAYRRFVDRVLGR